MLAKNALYISKISNNQAAHHIGLSLTLRALATSNHYACYSIMPAERRPMRQRDKRSNDPRQEDRIQMAIEGVNAGRYRSFKAAAVQLKVRKQA
jgi:hypothetical protein